MTKNRNLYIMKINGEFVVMIEHWDYNEELFSGTYEECKSFIENIM